MAYDHNADMLAHFEAPRKKHEPAIKLKPAKLRDRWTTKNFYIDRYAQFDVKTPAGLAKLKAVYEAGLLPRIINDSDFNLLAACCLLGEFASYQMVGAYRDFVYPAKACQQTIIVRRLRALAICGFIDMQYVSCRGIASTWRTTAEAYALFNEKLPRREYIRKCIIQDVSAPAVPQKIPPHYAQEYLRAQKRLRDRTANPDKLTPCQVDLLKLYISQYEKYGKCGSVKEIAQALQTPGYAIQYQSELLNGREYLHPDRGRHYWTSAPCFIPTPLAYEALGKFEGRRLGVKTTVDDNPPFRFK